jgi:hypothetical protein
VSKRKTGKEERKMGDAPRIASTRLFLNKIDPMWDDCWIDVRLGLGPEQHIAQEQAMDVDRAYRRKVNEAIAAGVPVPAKDADWFRADAAFYAAYCVPNGTNVTHNPETGKPVPSDPTDPDFFLGLPDYIGPAVQTFYNLARSQGLRERLSGLDFFGPRKVS